MDQDTPEILLACLSYASEFPKPKTLEHISFEDWRTVAALAIQQGVAPLLYQLLKQQAVALPGDVAEELEHAFLENITRNMRLYQELGKVLQWLREKNIPVIVLKGAYLAEAVYDNIGLRMMKDIDLLVMKDDLLRIEQELLLMGCVAVDNDREIGQQNKHYRFVLPKSGFLVEIHWVLVQAKFPFQIDMEGLWSRAQPVTLAQAPALVLSSEDLVLHLCLHAALHMYGMHLSMFYDIGEIVRTKGMELNWQSIGTRTQQWGILRSVYFILRLAQELLDVAVPADWLASQKPAGFEERYLTHARKQIFTFFTGNKIKISTNAAHFWDLKGKGSKLAFLRDALLPSREIMARWYPAEADSWRIYLYYPERWWGVLVHNIASLWRLARGDPKTQVDVSVMSLFEWLRSN